MRERHCRDLRVHAELFEDRPDLAAHGRMGHETTIRDLFRRRAVHHCAEHHAFTRGQAFERCHQRALFRAAPEAIEHPLAIGRVERGLATRRAHDLFEHAVEVRTLAHEPGCTRLHTRPSGAKLRGRRFEPHGRFVAEQLVDDVLFDE